MIDRYTKIVLTIIATSKQAADGTSSSSAAAARMAGPNTSAWFQGTP